MKEGRAVPLQERADKRIPKDLQDQGIPAVGLFHRLQTIRERMAPEMWGEG
jgi:hypothetical protein